MRKAICWFLMTLLMLPVMAQAQEHFTLSQVRDQAATGWHETYTDQYGRETVVDIDVDVFGEDTAPVLKVRFDDLSIRPELLPEGTKYEDRGKQIIMYLNNPADYVFGCKSGEKHLIVRRSYGDKIDMDTIYMPEYGTPITMQEMVDHLTAMLAQHGVETNDYVFDQPHDFSVRTKVKKSSGEVVEPAIYLAHFWQTLHGLPVLDHVADAFKQPMPREELWCKPQLVLGMRGEDEFRISAERLVEMETVAPDIRLAGFDDAKSTVEAMIEKGNVQRVLSMRLGYALYDGVENMGNLENVRDAECFYAVPMWVVECIYMDKPKQTYSEPAPQSDELNTDVRTENHYEKLFINAQTGELIDPNLRTKDRTEFKGVLTW